MRHPIDPKIDCVFKALLGSEENRNLLVHFLNAILGADLRAPVVDVDILNPYNAGVDGHSRDEAGHGHVEALFGARRELPPVPVAAGLPA